MAAEGLAGLADEMMMMGQAGEIWMDADDKQLAAAVGRLLKTSGQAADGWSGVATSMGSHRSEKSCRSRWEAVKNRPHLVSICGQSAGVRQAVSYGHILLEKAEQAPKQKDSEPRSNGLLSGTEWTTEEDNLLREAVRTCEVDGAVTSWSRVAQLVGNNRTAQPCRGRWRRLKKNDDKLGVRQQPSQEAQVAVQRLNAHLESMDDSDRMHNTQSMDVGRRGGGQALASDGQMDYFHHGGSAASTKQEEVMMDRPGWTAAWSYEHNTWYWWNERHETTWDDPAEGEPTLVPSEPVPQNREEQYMRDQMTFNSGHGYMGGFGGAGYAMAGAGVGVGVGGGGGGGAPALLPLSDKVLAKLKKDPNAPKRPIGAFLEFSRLRRPQIIEENPGIAFGSVGKVLGEEWRTMKPEIKKKFQDIEAADRQRYEADMEKYNSPTVKAAREEAAIAEVAAEEREPAKKKGRKKRKREEGEPTGARSSYLMFCAEIRGAVQAEYPDKKLTDQAKIISERWKVLTEEERNKYVEKAEKDKIRYETEIAEWNKPEAKQARLDAAKAAGAAEAAAKLAAKQAKQQAAADAAAAAAAVATAGPAESVSEATESST